MAKRDPVKTPFILALDAHIIFKNKFGDPHFLLLENNHPTTIKISLK